MIKHIISLSFFVLSYCTIAQNIAFRTANFKDKKEELKRAIEAIKRATIFLRLQMRQFFWSNLQN